ncbi:calcium/sodium antiporter [Intestinibacillus massiliensis]|nr:calcium/sodium antiporter [Intestinibacillus massiliensis]
MTLTVVAVLFFALGLYLTMRGGDAFVEAATFIAEVTGIPKIIIGATIVSVATTAPELFVSVLATLHGANDMAAGNAIGSVCCNIGLILGISLLFLPGRLPVREIRVKGALLFLSAILLGVFCVDNALEPVEGLVLFAVLGVFLFLNLRGASAGKLPPHHRLHAETPEKFRNGAKFVLGAAAVVLGAHLMVDNGALLARLFGVPEGIIGLTLVALGTSLPELVTTLTAIRRGEAAMSVGNILGANIIDLTLVLSASALASRGTLEVTAAVAARDVPVALILTGIALLPAMRDGRFRRLQGVALLAAYIGYIASLML